ncbi:hypothetical protein BS47DRAFT_817933 [Hydnum rufescens UP504]|uniref:Uncharacterized protein n=1 Tax=Hydnum rufescens UP504 TaxID=1448309 RepID=A0A9P6ADL7_9AGAM|nr:hypothetical protein BS47DRAFT_817933 [Hydnum rufescens UP504]
MASRQRTNNAPFLMACADHYTLHWDKNHPSYSSRYPLFVTVEHSSLSYIYDESLNEIFWFSGLFLFLGCYVSCTKCNAMDLEPSLLKTSLFVSGLLIPREEYTPASSYSKVDGIRAQ